MILFLKKVVQSVQTYRRYFREAMTGIYIYYTSPCPIHIIKEMATGQ